MDNQLNVGMPAMVALLLDEGARLWLEGALSAAQTHLERAFELANDLGNAAGRLGAMQLLASLAFARGDLEECYTLHSAVLTECRALRLDIGVASSLHNLGLVAALRGDFDTARGMIIAAINVYTVIGRCDAAAAARANLQRLAG
ncbi:MAG: hypothetical protein N2378_17455 [Chloroflexaceae bacterium]|nr:hypothetical protein [Chloroflexaceae bacterium]